MNPNYKKRITGEIIDFANFQIIEAADDSGAMIANWDADLSGDAPTHTVVGDYRELVPIPKPETKLETKTDDGTNPDGEHSDSQSTDWDRG
jgi:hypothetical protein